MMSSPEHIEVFTDGSCHTQKLTGAWVALIWIGGEKKVLQGVEHQTTHHRMELMAVLQAMAFLMMHHKNTPITVITDSQYVTGLIRREAALTTQNFITKAGKKITNDDLLVRFYELLHSLNISFVKVKAHRQNADVPYGNREADMLSRSLVRQAVQEIT